MYFDKSLVVKISDSLSFTNSFVTVISSSTSASAASKLISSMIRSMTVCNLRAPMFSTVLLRRAAVLAISRKASSSKVKVTPSVFINAICWITSYGHGGIKRS